MKGDVIIVEDYHREAARQFLPHLSGVLDSAARPLAITVAGESGSGKSELARAIADALAEEGTQALVLGQDDYFHLAPKSNDRKRREDPAWLGPHVEVNLALLDEHLKLVQEGASGLEKPLVNYDEDRIEKERLDLEGISALIAEGTYTSLLKHADLRIFILRNRLDTLAHRKKRNRGGEAEDPFIEDVLKIEHKIIAGHRNLADFLISKDFQLMDSAP